MNENSVRKKQKKTNRKRTALAGVVDEEDLADEAPRRPVHHRLDGAHQRRPGLVVEHDDDRRGRQPFHVKVQSLAPLGAKPKSINPWSL